MTVASVIECFTRVLGDGARWVHEADAQAVHEASLPVGWYRALHAGRSTGELERLTIEQIALRNRGN